MKDKKTYVLSGATSGIGFELLKKISESNIVFAGYRSEEKISEWKDISPNIIPFYVDYTKSETIVSATNFIKSKCDKIDTLINVAGIVVAGPIEKIPVSELKKQFDVNTFSHIEMVQNLIEYMHGGKIINISSMASFGIFPYISPYCASKKCLDMLFNSLLIENKHNLKIISVKPGVIATPLWNKSVKENIKHIDLCDGYEKEMNYLIKNAYKNEKNGLPIEKVVNLVLKIDKMNSPKLSYIIGVDAFWANIISKLPQNIVNILIKLVMKFKTR